MFKDALHKVGVRRGHHILVHSSYRKVKNSFGIAIDQVITDLEESVGNSGSIIMPAFTYNFKILFGSDDPFDQLYTPAKTGIVSEKFRNYHDVIRTASPTHSFSLWGEVKYHIEEDNSPKSPLGRNSVLEWMTNQENSYVLMLGTNFTSFTYGHYLENATPVPWADVSPWDHLFVQKAGVSTHGVQQLMEIPGCSKSFTSFEKYLLEHHIIKINIIDYCSIYYIPVHLLYEHGIKFFKENYKLLLCPVNKCRPCDERRKKLNIY